MRRRRRAFSLVEMIAVLVVIALLIGLAAYGYQRFVAGSRDRATEALVTQIARDVVGQAAASGSGPDLAMVDGSAAGTPATVAHAEGAGPSAGRLSLTDPAAPGADPGSSPSTEPERLSAAAAAPQNRLALALKSPTGRCAVAAADGARIRTGLWAASVSCSAADVLAGGVDFGGTEPDGVSPPTGLSVTSAPGSSEASVSWTGSAGASSYELYLDDADTPTWTGTGTTHTLVGLAPGPHQVRLVAVADGDRSAPAVAAFTVYCDNDAYACAHPIPADVTWTSADYDLATATLEAGEDDHIYNAYHFKTRWWTLTPAVSGTYEFSTLEPEVGAKPAGGASIRAWADNVAVPPAFSYLANGNNRITVHLVAGEPYRVSVGTYYNTESGQVRLSMTRGPDHDDYVNAVTVPALAGGQQVTLPDVDLAFAGLEPNEDAHVYNAYHYRTVWYRFTPSGTGWYTFTAADPGSGTLPANGVSFRHYTDNGTLPPVGSQLPMTYADGNTATTARHEAAARLVAGTTYAISMGVYTAANTGQVALRVTRGPANDEYDAAEPIPALAAGGQWVSTDLNLSTAGLQPGEDAHPFNAYHFKTVWFTFTAQHAGSYAFATVDPESGTRPSSGASVRVWNDGAAVPTVGSYRASWLNTGSLPLAAGETVRVSVGVYTREQTGQIRLSVQAP